MRTTLNIDDEGHRDRAADSGQAGRVSLDVEREIRIAVVMYGGVSLAVYMNGVSQELLQLVRATAPDATGRVARFTDDELGKAGASSARVYREISRLALTQQNTIPDPNAIHQRFVIDILSGTSAGGINAIFLAKAMANGQSMENLARLWETEGDIDKLINDSESLQGVEGLAPPKRPASLLNSQRMFVKLREAFDNMDVGGRPANGLVDEIDLFVTATDLGGLPVRLQLGGGEVAVERRYRQVFHMRYERDRWNEFTPEYNEFLAFCARCTSSFPIAFEPMQLQSMNADKALNPLWARHFDDHRKAAVRDPGTVAETSALSFGDGGYLDNKPFGYAIDAIAQRRGGDMGRVERKLIYIDPDPERLVPLPASSAAAPTEPNAVENALFAVNVPRYETIREELLRLRDRNRLVDKVTSVVRGVDDDFERLSPKIRQDLADVLGDRKNFPNRTLTDVIAVFGAAYGGAHRLKVAQLTDDISEAIASVAGVGLESDEYRALRLLVSKWRDTTYSINIGESTPVAVGAAPTMKTQFAMLEDFDLAYRIRRLSFVLERANQLRSLSSADLVATVAGFPKAFGAAADGGGSGTVMSGETLAAELDGLRLSLAKVLRALRRDRDDILGRSPRTAGTTASAPAATETMNNDAAATREIIAAVMRRPTERLRADRAGELVKAGSAGQQLLTRQTDRIGGEVQSARDRARTGCKEILRTDSMPSAKPAVWTSPAELATQILRHYYMWYELYDSMIFPLAYGSQVGEEIAPVEPVRVSPLGVHPVTHEPVPNTALSPSGVKLGHFGAFLDAGWRGRDMLIGRLNAAEKLVRTVLAGVPYADKDFMDAYVERAQGAVIEEEFARADSYLDRRLRDVKANLPTPKDRLRYVLDGRLTADPLPRGKPLDWVARSTKVLGRVFDRAAGDDDKVRTAARWLTRAGQLTTLLAEIALPSRWWGTSARKIGVLLAIFAVFMLVLGDAFGKHEVVTLGGQLLAATMALGIVTYMLGLWLRRKDLRITIILAVVTLTLMGFGAAAAWTFLATQWSIVVDHLPWR